MVKAASKTSVNRLDESHSITDLPSTEFIRSQIVMNRVRKVLFRSSMLGSSISSVSSKGATALMTVALKLRSISVNIARMSIPCHRSASRKHTLLWLLLNFDNSLLSIFLGRRRRECFNFVTTFSSPTHIVQVAESCIGKHLSKHQKLENLPIAYRRHSGRRKQVSSILILYNNFNRILQEY